MNFPDLHNNQLSSVGTSGLVLFGNELALSYIRDGNTSSFPNFVDLAGGGREGNESPYETFERELREEFNLGIAPEQIVYALRGSSMISPDKLGWFVVAKLQESGIHTIKFGNEGISYQITSLDVLINHKKLIPHRRQQIQGYLSKNACQ